MYKYLLFTRTVNEILRVRNFQFSGNSISSASFFCFCHDFFPENMRNYSWHLKIFSPFSSITNSSSMSMTWIKNLLRMKFASWKNLMLTIGWRDIVPSVKRDTIFWRKSFMDLFPFSLFLIHSATCQSVWDVRSLVYNIKKRQNF